MLTTKITFFKGLLLLPLAAAFLAGCAPPGPHALLSGKKLLERGRYPEAIAELKQATLLLSSNAQAWNYLGLAYHCAGQVTNAAQAYQKALLLNQDLAEVHYNFGCLWLEQNRLDAAKSELTTYTSLRKNSPDGWIKLAVAQLRSARSGPASARSPELAAADKSLHEALHLNPQNPEALNGLGLIQLERNLPREAAQSFALALKQQPDYAPALLNLAVVSQVQLNDRPAALQKYREYLALPVHAPNEEAVRAAAHRLEQELNPQPRAAATVNATSPPPSSANLTRTTARNPGQPAARPPTEPAITAVNAAPAPAPVERKIDVTKIIPEPVVKSAQDVSSSPEPASLVQTKSPAASSKEESRRSGAEGPVAVARVDPSSASRRESRANPQSTSVSPRPGSGSGALAVSARNGPGDFIEDRSGPAVPGPRYPYRTLTKPVAGDSAAAQRAFAQGFQAQQANRLPEAIQSYRQATQLDPASYDAYYNLGLAATAAGNLRQALLAYESAVVVRPESPDARYNFAMVLKRANYLQDAINQLRIVLASYPSEPRAHLALGNIYAQVLHQPAKAREHYTKVLEIAPHTSQAAAIREWLMANPP
jgi:tetratricopeptide (TPR) repeat protein